MLGGTPNVWISLRAAQDALFQGEDIVTTIVVQGEPETLPAGLVADDERARSRRTASAR